MQLIIDVNSAKTQTKRGTSAKTGKPYEITTQRGFFHSVDAITGETLPLPIDLQLGPNDFPYEPGRYTIEPTSFVVGQFGDLRINRLKLTKLQNLQVAKSA